MHTFSIQRADAGHTLHTFVVQANVVMFFVSAGRLDRVLTKPIHGQMTARQALTMMLRGTHLVAVWRHDTALGGDYVEVGRERAGI